MALKTLLFITIKIFPFKVSEIVLKLFKTIQSLKSFSLQYLKPILFINWLFVVKLDNNPVYKLRCKQYEYSGEIIDTGILTIDAIEDELSLDSTQFQFTLEQPSILGRDLTVDITGFTIDNTNVTVDVFTVSSDPRSFGESILLENSADTGESEYLIAEDYIVGDGSTDKTAQNELFELLDDKVLDFSEENPFGDAGSL